MKELFANFFSECGTQAFIYCMKYECIWHIMLLPLQSLTEEKKKDNIQLKQSDLFFKIAPFL